MNFLAHAYLSFGHPDILVGNMISDFVKGRKQYNYPELIHKGIVLHRQIDTFTDQHAATHAAKEIFRPYYRLYSGPLTDIIFDHYLANDETAFPSNELPSFVERVYDTLEVHSPILPANFLKVFPYMRSHNWLLNYRERWGIERSMKGLVGRSRFLSDHQTAFALFNEQYNELGKAFEELIKDVKTFSRQQLMQLLY